MASVINALSLQLALTKFSKHIGNYCWKPDDHRRRRCFACIGPGMIRICLSQYSGTTQKISGKGAGGDGERWVFDIRELDELGGRPRVTRWYHLTQISKTDTY